MRQSYSLEEVADAQLPAEWTDGVRWLSRRLNRGELTGFRVGRSWRMTDEDVDFLIEKHRRVTTVRSIRPVDAEKSQPTATNSFADALSARSRSRLRNVS